MAVGDKIIRDLQNQTSQPAGKECMVSWSGYFLSHYFADPQLDSILRDLAHMADEKLIDETENGGLLGILEQDDLETKEMNRSVMDEPERLVSIADIPVQSCK